MLGRRDELALEAAREGGKPLVDSRVEADRAINSVQICADTLRSQVGTEIPMNVNAAFTGRLAFTQQEPIGVVVAFSAFNHPLNLIAHQVGPAVAAGCPVIVKPAEATPLSCMRFVEILREAGLPEVWCQALLTTDLDLASTLVTDDRVGFFGSSQRSVQLRPVYMANKSSINSDLRGWRTPSVSGEELQTPGVRPTGDGGIARGLPVPRG